MHYKPSNGQGSTSYCLCLKEKLAVTGMLLLLATFAALSFAKKHQKFSSCQKTIHVHCYGACIKEKEVELASGAQVSDLLTRIELTDDADLDKLILEERLKDGARFIIPRKGMMTLYVTGAVDQPGVIFTPEDLRFNQLKMYLSFTDNADLEIFQRRRRQLVEGETIHVPARSEYIVRK